MCTYHFLKKKKKKVEWICGNAIAEIGEKNCGNAIAKIGGKNLWQTNCGNDIAEKRKKKKICGNAIAEIGGKNCDKLIVAMALPKYGKK